MFSYLTPTSGCDMSMTLNNKKYLSSFIVKSKPITNKNFYILLLTIIITSFLLEFVNILTKSRLHKYKTKITIHSKKQRKHEKDSIKNIGYNNSDSILQYNTFFRKTFFRKFRLLFEHLFAAFYLVFVPTVFVFFCSWSIMMLSMTSNVYILCAIVLGKVSAKLVSFFAFNSVYCGFNDNECCM
ncbi:hypothetical protein EDEG_02289 [Edhazardia aedis USNM 41457]|uniref:Copper transport protein n=1 Tax=Edhazardia aedis (strain USNM 41457) TaxID=1003232 RepID=J9D769_EDHAE|nr:hypothetical protein EDEG_02289 [Edhazardia aedis USNM 41457]|eukprot:EJW03379.1 hypothetical protein EDEG_02289 [Edhazardia aedis USNM 41457]